jgi:putative Mn2+ efflux pump MntP
MSERRIATVSGCWSPRIATSLDAMAVGVGLAFLQVNIIATALAMAAPPDYVDAGMMVGRFIGPLLGKRAEILAVSC